MPRHRSDPLTSRTTAAIIKLLRTAADREHRSIANMVGVLIWDYCGRNGITIQEQRALFDEDQKSPTETSK